MKEKINILVVEDERIVAEDIQGSLKNIGYAVTDIVSSGAEAIELAGRLNPDLILMDIVIRGEINGIETAEKIRTLYDLPVVYLTAYADESTLERAKVTEPFGYILKPFSDRELHSTIEMALYKHSMDRRLKEREVWFSTTLRSIGDGVIATDEKGRITFMNAIAEALTGWEEIEAVGKPLYHVFKIVEEKTGLSVTIPIVEIIKTKRVQGLSSNTLLITRDGNRIPIGDSAGPIIDDKGRVLGVVLAFKEITERKLAEEALRLSEERYRGLFETMNQGVVYYDFNGKITDCNPAAERIFGIKIKELSGKTAMDPIWQTVKEDGNSLPEERHPVLVTLRSGKPKSNVVLGIMTNIGKRKWLLVSTTPVFNKGEKVPTSVFQTITDITRRKEVEFSLHTRNVQLSSMNTIARSVSGTLELKVILGHTLKEVMRLAEFSAGAMFLFNEEESVSELEMSHGLTSRDVSKLTRLFRNVLISGNTEKFVMRHVFKAIKVGNLTLKNKLMDRDCLVVPIKESDSVLGALLLFGDEKKLPPKTEFEFFSSIGSYIGLVVKNARLYEETNRTLKELRITQDKLVQSEKLAGLGALASNIVHEVGNPLAAIMNSVQVLQNRVQLEGRMKELMDIIGWETERLNDSIDMLREFSRPSELRRVKSDLREVVKKAIFILNQDFDLIWDKKIKTNFPEEFPLLLLDPYAMEQVVLNVIKNSLQAINEGGEVRVRLRRKNENQIVMKIRDNGLGIIKENLNRIFEPYFSTKARGMGLGMHIVKQIVEAHGGEVVIKSERGKGTTVDIIIPVEVE
jgi:PAS domain S-box-containing protein